MPQNHRKKRSEPIRPALFWCMKCFRTSVKAYDPRVMDEPFEVKCTLDAAASVLCQQCSRRRDTCEGILTGILGDAADFSALLQWSAAFWEEVPGPNGVPLFVWPATLRPEIAEAVLVLATAFSSAHRAHASAWSLSGTAKKNKEEAERHYKQHVVTDRRGLAHICPPSYYASAEEWEAYHSSLLSRLQPGDDGYVAWLSAKHAFYADVVAECVRQYGDETTVEGFQVLTELETTFPLHLPRI